jgi:hypothetical protein
LVRTPPSDDALGASPTSRSLEIHLPAIARTRRLPALALTLCLAALCLLLMIPSGAPARSLGAHKSTCTTTKSRHSKRGARRCPSHQGHKSKSHKHKPVVKKPAHKVSAPAVELTPATCEDGSLPSRAKGGSYSCEDGSEPFCEDGSEPTLAHGSGAPMCTVSAPGSESNQEECEASGECQAVEFACEDTVESQSGAEGCEAGSSEESGQETDS